MNDTILPSSRLFKYLWLLFIHYKHCFSGKQQSKGIQWHLNKVSQKWRSNNKFGCWPKFCPYEPNWWNFISGYEDIETEMYEETTCHVKQMYLSQLLLLYFFAWNRYSCVPIPVCSFIYLCTYIGLHLLLSIVIWYWWN